LSDIAHLVWLVIAAVVVAAVLLVGTLGAADLLPRRRTPKAPAGGADDTGPAGGDACVSPTRSTPARR
jgi:hypothetical protein